MLQNSFSNVCPCTKYCRHDTTAWKSDVKLTERERETVAERSKLELEE